MMIGQQIATIIILVLFGAFSLWAYLESSNWRKKNR